LEQFRKKSMNLQTPVKDAGLVYKKYAKRLASLGIEKIEDFLYHLPFRYEDYSLISSIEKLQEGETVTVIGKVVQIKNEYRKNFKTIQRATIADETGEIEVIWFNQPYLPKTIHSNDTIAIAGKVGKNSNKPVFISPDFEVIFSSNKPVTTIHTGRLVPIYPETKGVSSKWLRRQNHKIISEYKDFINEQLPYSIVRNVNLMGLIQSIEQIHFPISIEYSKRARLRLAFDEIFYSQLSGMYRRASWEKTLKGNPFVLGKFQKNIENLIASLPFLLTNAQKTAIREIFKDIQTDKPMNRLLEGDVGSGKTVVSAITMYLAFLNGYQSVLMAPTEILAKQHYTTVSKLLSPFGVKVELVTGNKKMKNEKKDKKNRKQKENPKTPGTQSFNILVGTHAVLSKNIYFDNLGFVVIDEQQRFGVEQRSGIRSKGKSPHFLTMTATPIPRTIALTMYGDLDLSLLNEMPKGRKLIKTWLVPREKRNNAYLWIKKQIKETSSQAFIICPFIEESESMQSVKAATIEFEKLKKQIFPDLKLGLLHGKMKTKEKDEALRKFKENELDMLVATPVVEVGIDIPNATIIVIEASERFGLAQLHQLRGRVGRGEKQSYCLLFTESKNPQTIAKLKAMERMHIGAELAEFDLHMRGAGDIYGTVQHGQKFFKIATFSDNELIEKAKKEAERIFPELKNYPLLMEKLKKQTSQEISPD